MIICQPLAPSMLAFVRAVGRDNERREDRHGERIEHDRAEAAGKCDERDKQFAGVIANRAP